MDFWGLTLVANDLAFIQPHSTIWADIRHPHESIQMSSNTNVHAAREQPYDSHVRKTHFTVPF